MALATRSGQGRKECRGRKRESLTESKRERKRKKRKRNGRNCNVWLGGNWEKLYWRPPGFKLGLTHVVSRNEHLSSKRHCWELIFVQNVHSTTNRMTCRRSLTTVVHFRWQTCFFFKCCHLICLPCSGVASCGRYRNGRFGGRYVSFGDNLKCVLKGTFIHQLFRLLCGDRFQGGVQVSCFASCARCDNWNACLAILCCCRSRYGWTCYCGC